jgi:hypothetical protein
VDRARPIDAATPTDRPTRGRGRVTVVLPWDLDPRMATLYRTWDEAIQATADAHRASLEPSPASDIDEDGG